MKTVNFILRLLAAPFLLVLMLITFSAEALRRMYHFLQNGGEVIIYDKTYKAMINDIYQELKKQK